MSVYIRKDLVKLYVISIISWFLEGLRGVGGGGSKGSDKPPFKLGSNNS